MSKQWLQWPFRKEGRQLIAVAAILLSVALVVILFLFGNSTTSYSSPDGLFSIRFPEDWAHKSDYDEKNHSQTLSIISPDSNIPGNTGVTVRLSQVLEFGNEFCSPYFDDNVKVSDIQQFKLQTHDVCYFKTERQAHYPEPTAKPDIIISYHGEIRHHYSVSLYKARKSITMTFLEELENREMRFSDLDLINEYDSIVRSLKIRE